jgi:uroporphyrinogen decarboxylase
MTPMTPKERVLRAIRRESIDRLPRSLWIGSGAAGNIQKELGIDKKDIEFYVKNDVLQTWLSINKQMTVAAAEGEEFVDEWGITWRRNGYYNSPVHHPFADMNAAEIQNAPFPDPYNEARYEEFNALVETYSKEYFIGADVSGTLFEPAYHLRSMEKLMMDLAEENDEADILLDRLRDFSAKVSIQAVELGADWIWLGDDMGTQISMLMSPAMWRKHFKPRLKSIIDEIKTKKRDMIVAYHSCGSIRPIIGELAEIGIDVLNPIQESAADMDQKAIKEAYGEKLTFMCGLDTQTFLTSASPKEVYSRMLEKAQILGKGGGYIGAVSHTIQHDIPVENIRALVQALDDFTPSSQ